MKIALTGLTALSVWRRLRAGELPDVRPGERLDAPTPDPAPHKRWTGRAFDLGFLGIKPPDKEGLPLECATPDPAKRIRTAGVSCAVRGSLPPGSFVDVGRGVCIASPELLFAEVAVRMELPVQLLLGMELCGRYTRSAASPRDGGVVFDVGPVTSAARIADFAHRCTNLPCLEQTRRAADLIADNAWSPVEALLAALAMLEPWEGGYGLGRVVLNRRIAAGESSRVPDLLFEGTRVGLNYDGGVHFCLKDVARAAGGDDEEGAMSRARAKIVDDKRRERDILCAGYTVLPVTSEDLYEPGGLDAVMWQAAGLIERETGRDLGARLGFLRRPKVSAARQRNTWSLLPGKRAMGLSCEIAAEHSRDMERIKAAFALLKGPEREGTEREGPVASSRAEGPETAG